jgi:hypothetical protein
LGKAVSNELREVGDLIREVSRMSDNYSKHPLNTEVAKDLASCSQSDGKNLCHRGLLYGGSSLPVSIAQTKSCIKTAMIFLTEAKWLLPSLRSLVVCGMRAQT